MNIQVTWVCVKALTTAGQQLLAFNKTISVLGFVCGFVKSVIIPQVIPILQVTKHEQVDIIS